MSILAMVILGCVAAQLLGWLLEHDLALNLVLLTIALGIIFLL